MILENVREDLAELDAEFKATSRNDGWGMWLGLAGFGALGYFASKDAPWWMAGIALFLLYRLFFQSEYVLIRMRRNEVVMRAILSKLESMKPEPKYD